ncbi:MAG: OmpH family outer membrane protein [Myxococcota bacterium]
MRNTKVIVASLVLLSLLAAPAALAAETKIGVVDVEHVVMNSKRGQAAKQKLQRIFEKKQAELDARQKELMELKQRLESQSTMWKESKKKEAMMEYQQGVMKLQEDFVAQQQELAKKEMEMMRPILGELEKVLKAIAKRDGYDIIMNRSQQGVIYARPAYDITDKALEELDEK